MCGGRPSHEVSNALISLEKTCVAGASNSAYVVDALLTTMAGAFAFMSCVPSSTGVGCLDMHPPLAFNQTCLPTTCRTSAGGEKLLSNTDERAILAFPPIGV